MRENSCNCGNTSLVANDQCCVSKHDICTNDNSTTTMTSCVNGVSIKLEDKCNDDGVCYNSYQQSKHVGPDAHITCHGTDQCVPFHEVKHQICKGISLCSQGSYVDECSKSSLKCFEAQKRGIPNSEVAPNHHFCEENGFSNNGMFDQIDREDETDIELLSINQKINHTKIAKCTVHKTTTCDDNTFMILSRRYKVRKSKIFNCSIDHEYPGLMCGEKCKSIEEWCTSENAGACNHGNDKDGKPILINTNSKQLCGNHTFWKNIPCEIEYTAKIATEEYTLATTVDVRFPALIVKNGNLNSLDWGSLGRSEYKIPVKYVGYRCNGTFQNCIYPKYLQKVQVTKYETQKFLESCSDKSDHLFKMNTKCDPKIYGRRCQSSCALPGKNCDACTNPTFFNCTKSQQCIHQDIVCDGHPQCQQGEDEDLDLCHEIYVKKKIVSKFATHRCKAATYSGNAH